MNTSLCITFLLECECELKGEAIQICERSGAYPGYINKSSIFKVSQFQYNFNDLGFLVDITPKLIFMKFYICVFVYFVYLFFILSAISPYSTGLRALFNPSDCTGTVPPNSHSPLTGRQRLKNDQLSTSLRFFSLYMGRTWPKRRRDCLLGWEPDVRIDPPKISVMF